MALKKLSELIHMHFIKDPDIEAISEIELINPQSRRAEMVFKGKEKITIKIVINIRYTSKQ